MTNAFQVEPPHPFRSRPIFDIISGFSLGIENLGIVWSTEHPSVIVISGDTMARFLATTTIIGLTQDVN